MRILFLSLILILLNVRSEAAPCTNMQLQTSQTNIDFTNNPSVNPVFTVKANTNPGGCSFFVVFDYGSSNSYSTRSLKMSGNNWPFQIAKDSSGNQIIKNFPDVSSSNDVLSGDLAGADNNTQVNVNYWALLNLTNPWLRFGNYTENLTASLYRGTISSYEFIQSKSISFNYNVPKRVDLSLVSTGGAFDLTQTTKTMDFGSLTAGDNRSVDLVLKYNAGYVLLASSQNKSRLKHQSQNVFIPYTVSFRGTATDLSSGGSTQVFRELGASPASGLVIPIKVTIGSFSPTQSGSYGDVITLTVQSSE